MTAAPSSVLALLLLGLAVLPGATYMWGFERQVAPYGVTLADRAMRFLGASLVVHFLFAVPEYFVYRAVSSRGRIDTAQFLMLWGAALVLAGLPFGTGTVLGGLYRTRRTRHGWTWVRRALSEQRERGLLHVALGRDPAPRAWDDLFEGRPDVYIRVRTTSGTWLAGLFAGRSYAAGFPQDTDLLLEEGWEVDPDSGLLGDHGLGYAVYVPADQIAWLEVVDPWRSRV